MGSGPSNGGLIGTGGGPAALVSDLRNSLEVAGSSRGETRDLRRHTALMILGKPQWGFVTGLSPERGVGWGAFAGCLTVNLFLFFYKFLLVVVWSMKQAALFCLVSDGKWLGSSLDM
jgi:hypothetical protein